MIPIPTSLQHRVGNSPTSPEQLDWMAKRAWLEGDGDMVTLRLSRVSGWDTRQEIINEANRQHGTELYALGLDAPVDRCHS